MAVYYIPIEKVIHVYAKSTFMLEIRDIYLVSLRFHTGE